MTLISTAVNFFKFRTKQIVFLLLSFVIVTAAQPDWSRWACVVASCVGYALFWKGMLLSEQKRSRFCLAVLWFAGVEAFHLNWFFADRYVGGYIYPFLFLLFVGLGAQFGMISLFIRKPKMDLLQMLAISGGWTLFEWSRLHLLSGFSWDPVGLALTGTTTGMQMASAVGVYGLSFWVFFTNLLALRLFSNYSLYEGGVWAAVLATPYVFGITHLAIHSRLMELDPHPPLRALLVQTSLMPEEKMPLPDALPPLSPYQQWERILKLLHPYLDNTHDLIVLSEGVVPYGTDYPIYLQEKVLQSFKGVFPQFNAPLSERPRVGNRYWAQSLANFTGADVVLGLEDVDPQHAYNAAFLLRPFEHQNKRYEKRILVPMGEYIPFEWCKRILAKYGITDSFTPGKKAQLFEMKNRVAGISICYEETYGHLMLSNRRQGADVLINLTNDVWYPRSRLPMIHCLHGGLRAVEGGLPLLRSCNTGVTCGVDSLGRVVDLPPF